MSTSRGASIPDNNKDYMTWLNWKYKAAMQVMSRPDWRGEDLRRCDLRERAVPGADMGAAVLAGMDLTDIELRGAYAVEANLSGATLVRAGLRLANLQDADIRGAALRFADLNGADLRGADLRDIKDYGIKLGSTRLFHDDLGDLALKPVKLWKKWLRQNSGIDGFRFSKAERKQLDLMYKCRLNGTSYAGANPLVNLHVPWTSEDYLADRGILIRYYDEPRFVSHLFKDNKMPNGKRAFSGGCFDAHLVNVPADIEVFYLDGSDFFLEGAGILDEVKTDTLPKSFMWGSWESTFHRRKGVIVTIPPKPSKE